MSTGSKCRGESDLGLYTTSGLTNKSTCAELTSDEKTWLDAKVSGRFSGRRLRSIQPHLNWVFATQQRENERPQVEKLEKIRHWQLNRTPTQTWDRGPSRRRNSGLLPSLLPSFNFEYRRPLFQWECDRHTQFLYAQYCKSNNYQGNGNVVVLRLFLDSGREQGGNYLEWRSRKKGLIP